MSQSVSSIFKKKGHPYHHICRKSIYIGQNYRPGRRFNCTLFILSHKSQHSGLNSVTTQLLPQFMSKRKSEVRFQVERGGDTQHTYPQAQIWAHSQVLWIQAQSTQNFSCWTSQTTKIPNICLESHWWFDNCCEFDGISDVMIEVCHSKFLHNRSTYSIDIHRNVCMLGFGFAFEKFTL